MLRRWILALVLIGAAPVVWADEPGTKKDDAPRQAAKPAVIPYRLTNTHHVMVRAKINGKGPFNFIVDTGCPVLIVSGEVGKKLGLSADKKGWTLLDKFEIEGGLAQEKVKCRVETPFQIEGMNSMGLPGVELHGLLGYTVIAKYKMEFDFKADTMRWTPLAFDPPPPAPLGGKAPAGLEMMGSLLKFLSAISGIKPAPPPVPRGFFGFEVDEKDGTVLVKRVLPGTPAAKAGLQAGDRIDSVEDDEISNAADLLSRAAKLTAGRPLSLTVTRGKDQQTLKITAGNGL
jgi:membrane-associated protease RseP (regulator of RpoE activity)